MTFKTITQLEKEIKEKDTFQKKNISDGEFAWNLRKREISDLKATLKRTKEIIKMIDGCKIHTAGALILIEKKELLSKINGNTKSTA
jgi:hypothetical protein